MGYITMCRGRVLVAAVGLIVLISPGHPQTARAQSGEITGPGQTASSPSPLCAQVLACNYQERNIPETGYRVQSLEVCGANCTTQYWVSLKDDRKQVLQVDPTRGGGIVAVKLPVDGETRPAVRTILPNYAPTDPACCPSAFSDITYTWDEQAESLGAGEPVIIPADEFGGWDAARERLAADGFRDPLRRG
jgi:hypothetical protein